MADSEDREKRLSLLGTKTPYEIWLESEGVPVIKTFFVEDIRKVPLESWERKGGFGAFLNMEGAEGINDCYICEIPPGRHLKPQRHLFEETIYVLNGKGATSVWLQNRKKVTFEWQAGSLFSPPLNAWHQHFNGGGTEPVRYVAVTTAPTMINLFHNTDFIFNNDFTFTDRFEGDSEYFSGQGRLFGGDYRGQKVPGHVLETNFIPDVRTNELWPDGRRGGGTKVRLELSENTTICHISEFPVGTYKKAHHHGPGAHVIILGGHGYSLIWPQGESMQRYDWHEGAMVVPPGGWWHQHFNTGREPARYLALRTFGSRKYRGLGESYKGDLDRRKGGAQIQYDDEDPMVRRMFEEALAKVDLKSQMDAVYRRVDV